MEFRLSLMDLVSPTSTATNQGIKTMHPQGTSAPFGQQSHLPPSLSNMHTNANPAHNYQNQHSFSLNLSTNPGAFTNQNQSEQAPASNHPVANPSTVSQAFSLQKNNIQPTIVSTNSTPTLTVQPSDANVAPQVVEPSVPEKTQANGTTEGEPSQHSFARSGIPSLIPKDKSPVPVQSTPQAMEIDAPTEKESAPESSLPPASANTSQATDPLTLNAKSEDSNDKPTQVVPNSKEADSLSASSTVPAQPKVKPPTPSNPEPEEQDPLAISEAEVPEPMEQVENPVLKVEVQNDESKAEKDPLNVDSESTGADKSTPMAEESTKEASPVKEVSEVKTPVKATARKTKTVTAQEVSAAPAATSTPGTAKRQRIRTQHYQSPLPEVELVSKISSTSLKSIKNNDDKLIVFNKNEFLAVRNAESGFYLCQAIQNISKSSSKIRIRWLSQDKSNEKQEVYTPDFYDLIDFDCILTNLSLGKADKGKFILPPSERSRTESILNRSLAVEKGEEISSPSLTEEHPDGLDVSLLKEEDLLTKKRKAKKRSRKTTQETSSPKNTPTQKSPKASKARKVEPPAKTPVKKTLVKKPVPTTSKKSAPSAVSSKSSTNTTKTSKSTGKPNSKSATKASPVVDQKKAKVLARIGKKTAVSAAKKSAKNNTKNEKSGNKSSGSSKKAVQAKVSSNGSVKSSTRPLRKSTRK